MTGIPLDVVAAILVAGTIVLFLVTRRAGRERGGPVATALLVTGDTGMRTFFPGGKPSRMTPPEEAADHRGPRSGWW